MHVCENMLLTMPLFSIQRCSGQHCCLKVTRTDGIWGHSELRRVCMFSLCMCRFSPGTLPYHTFWHICNSKIGFRCECEQWFVFLCCSVTKWTNIKRFSRVKARLFSKTIGIDSSNTRSPEENGWMDLVTKCEPLYKSQGHYLSGGKKTDTELKISLFANNVIKKNFYCLSKSGCQTKIYKSYHSFCNTHTCLCIKS